MLERGNDILTHDHNAAQGKNVEDHCTMTPYTVQRITFQCSGSILDINVKNLTV